MHTQIPEEVLINRARRGDGKAFEALALKYKDRLFGIAAAVCAQMPSESDDVAQETFVAALKHIRSFRANAAFGTWLYRIAANNCWQRLRRTKIERRADLPGESSKGHPARSCVNENTLKNELSRAVSAALAALPAEQRMAVTLCDIEGRAGAEAAALLGISLSALKSRLRRGRLLLKGQLRDFS